jgi:ADP-heptose:LPS heptosyltransferase
LGRWIALAEDFAANDYDVVFTGSGNQQPLNDLAIAEIKPSVRQRIRNAAGSTLHETMRLLSRADLLVTVDTGVMHMAAALEVPLIALHGPSNPRRWGPVSEKALVVESPLGGCGFLNLGFENSRRAPACMNAISYGQVKSACGAVLGVSQLEPQPQLSMPVFSSSVRGLASTSASKAVQISRAEVPR